MDPFTASSNQCSSVHCYLYLVSCNQDTASQKILSGVCSLCWLLFCFWLLHLVKQTFIQASPSVVPLLPTHPPTLIFFSSALHIKAGERQQTGDDVLKVFPAIQLWSALHLCAATITGFAQRCVCGVFTAGSVLVHGGSFLKSLTPRRGNAALWELLCWCKLTRRPFSGVARCFSIQWYQTRWCLHDLDGAEEDLNRSFRPVESFSLEELKVFRWQLASDVSCRRLLGQAFLFGVWNDWVCACLHLWKGRGEKERRRGELNPNF